MVREGKMEEQKTVVMCTLTPPPPPENATHLPSHLTVGDQGTGDMGKLLIKGNRTILLPEAWRRKVMGPTSGLGAGVALDL